MAHARKQKPKEINGYHAPRFARLDMNLIIQRNFITVTSDNHIIKLVAIGIALSFSGCENATNEGENQTKLNYSEVMNGDFVGFASSEIEARLGEPEHIVDAGGRKIWNYGPSIEDMAHADQDGIVGLTIYFDEHDKVKSIRAKTKTSDVEAR